LATSYLLTIALLIFSLIFIFKLLLGPEAWGTFIGTLLRDITIYSLRIFFRLICLPFKLAGRAVRR